MDRNLNVNGGKLYCDNELVGNSNSNPGFTQYIFDEEPLGNGANAVTYGVTHKILGVRQVVKIYFPADNETNIIHKAKEESIKNANPMLSGIIAVIFDAGEYIYPCRLWYSVMESVTAYATIKEWREKRNVYFTSNKNVFNVREELCKSSIHTSLNLAAGLLKTLIGLYEKDIIHGDLNPGNILWILEMENLEEALKKYSSPSYSSLLGTLNPYTVKLIDMGTSKANPCENAGIYRDSYKIYDHLRSLMSPLFSQSKKTHFSDWFNFECYEEEKYKEYDVECICGIKAECGKIMYITPEELASDCFRLVCVITIALGIISNHTSNTPKSISLDIEDICDFRELMYGVRNNKEIEAFSFDTMITLEKINKSKKSWGRLINWENLWRMYPFNLIDSSLLMTKSRDDFAMIE